MKDIHHFVILTVLCIFGLIFTVCTHQYQKEETSGITIVYIVAWIVCCMSGLIGIYLTY